MPHSASRITGTPWRFTCGLLVVVAAVALNAWPAGEVELPADPSSLTQVPFANAK